METIVKALETFVMVVGFGGLLAGLFFIGYFGGARYDSNYFRDLLRIRKGRKAERKLSRLKSQRS